MPEIDAAELANLRQLQSVFTTMLNHPEAREMVLRAQKKVNPNVAIPEIDAADQVAAPLKEKLTKTDEALAEIQKQLAEDRASRESERKLADFKAAWDAQKSRLRNNGYLDGAIENIEKIAHEKGIADLEIAAAVYDKQQPPASPVQPTGFGSWNFFEEQEGPNQDEFLKSLMNTRGEAEGTLHKQINSVLREARGQRAA